MKSPSPSGWLVAIVCCLVAAFVLLWRGCGGQPGAREATLSPTAERSDSPPPENVSPPVGAPAPISAPATPPSPSSPHTGMVSMNFRFEKGRLVESAREVVAQASVRSLRNIEGQAGLYHRIVGPDGAVLFENLVPDPRRVPWDTTDDGKHLIGGVATLNEMPLILRLPGGIHGRLEIYEVADVKWTRSTLDKATQLVGSFSL